MARSRKRQRWLVSNERGANWIPGSDAASFSRTFRVTPARNPTTQYVYVSDGANYKLLAAWRLARRQPERGSAGIKLDPTRNPTPEHASFGFWTPGFAGA